jgi:hypothetical protein
VFLTTWRLSFRKKDPDSKEAKPYGSQSGIPLEVRSRYGHFFPVLRIRDPGLGAFLTPGSGIRYGRVSGSGSGMNNPDHIF